MNSRTVIAVMVLDALVGLDASAADARNRYRTERIYALTLQPGETCASAWQRQPKPTGSYAIRGAGRAPVRFGMDFAVTKDGRRCIVTVFSISDPIE